MGIRQRFAREGRILKFVGGKNRPRPQAVWDPGPVRGERRHWRAPFQLECYPFRRVTMAEATEVRRAGPTTVRDVPADEFIKAFAAYLKKTGKVCRGLARK